MIPFNRALPYDLVMGDIYVSECPFCGKENVLVPMKPNELESVRDGKKKLLVFPCCHHKLTVLDSDEDYLLTDTIVRH
ncbi:hypothetical protein DCC85_18060 [Paenibacillus sp. CAA11]|uniref:hypothetical protein n=1 Tax=Paenibacillus sp. CAA11 TaxID=1532905 RepID=UPI000D359820|nr:hypothetical protein [Paenibacillus sp. CAA11]AWB45907.1 hypothetical protein DCC85_18060 [Paenibacillus sp. CAA11]